MEQSESSASELLRLSSVDGGSLTVFDKASLDIKWQLNMLHMTQPHGIATRDLSDDIMICGQGKDNAASVVSVDAASQSIVWAYDFKDDSSSSAVNICKDVAYQGTLPIFLI